MFRFIISKIRFAIICFVLLSPLLFINCNNSNAVTGAYPFVRAYNQTEVDSIIANNDTTIIFLWTEWCNASQNVFKENIVPFLSQKANNIGFISIFYGKEDVIASILENNQCLYPSYCLTSYSGIDKRSMYYLLNSFLEDYKQMDFVPISLMCNKNGNILNYEDEIDEYSGIINCINTVDTTFY
jgi:hypothetical protein